MDGETALSLLLCPEKKKLWRTSSSDYDLAIVLLDRGVNLYASNSTRGSIKARAWARRDIRLMEFLKQYGIATTEEQYDRAWKFAMEAKFYKPIIIDQEHDLKTLRKRQQKLEEVKAAYSSKCELLDAYAESDVACYGRSLVSVPMNSLGNLIRAEEEREKKRKYDREIIAKREEEFKEFEYLERQERTERERAFTALAPLKHSKTRRPRKSASTDSIECVLGD